MRGSIGQSRSQGNQPVLRNQGRNTMGSMVQSNQGAADNSTAPKKEVTLSDTEKQTFGNRSPSGYKKLRILGK